MSNFIDQLLKNICMEKYNYIINFKSIQEENLQLLRYLTWKGQNNMKMHTETSSCFKTICSCRAATVDRLSINL